MLASRLTTWQPRPCNPATLRWKRPRDSWPSRFGVAAAGCLACLAAWGTAVAQDNPGNGLAIGRQLLAEDNPGELWVERGKQLFY